MKDQARQSPTPRQPSLFPEDATDGALVRVGVIGTDKRLSKAQRAFNRWTKRIEAQRLELEHWRGFGERLQARVAGDFEPLRRRCVELRIDLLRRFDQAHDGGALGKRERTRIGKIILDLASALLEETDDPAVVALHDKYGDVSHDELRRQEAAAMQSLLEGMLGTDFDDELRTPEDVMTAAARWLDAEQAGWDESGDEAQTAEGRGGRGTRRDAADGSPSAGKAGGRSRPRSASAQARIEREQAIADGATRSIRDLYRKLASALHPDREPDPVERERKTQLMKQVNQANEARDLLQLLTLQIDVEQLDLAGLAQVDDTRIAHYNRVLKEQSERLDEEISALVAPFATMMPHQAGRPPSPDRVMDMLQEDIAAKRAESQRLTQEVAMFEDVLTLKAWLKTVRITRARREVFDDDPAAMIQAMVRATPAGAGQAGGPRRRRKRH